jgi:hypothetical protein
MDFRKGEAADTATPRQHSLDPASVGQVLRGGPADAHDIEAFWQAISLPAAARTARYGNLPQRSTFPLGVQKDNPMNTIVYIVGLVVIVGVVLAFLGLR